MAEYDFDLFTIGAGSGGVAASRRAGAYGARVAICEEGRVGGTCVMRGCVPKKLLMYASHYRDELADAAGYGYSMEEPRFDWSRLIAAKDKEIARLGAVYVRMLNDAGVQIIEGRARVIDAHTVEVGGQRYRTGHILIATGGRPFVPALRGAELGITSNEALDLPSLPRHLVIVGGGYIGAELAGVFSSLGTKVSMLIRGDAVLRGFDADLRTALTNEMQKRGVRFYVDTNVADLERQGGALSLMLDSGDTLEADVVLFATGRLPNTGELGLEGAGVALDANGAVVVDAHSRSSVPTVYAVGDCTDRVNLTPVAVAEGRAVAETLFNKRPTAIDHESVASAVFSQPPVGTVGLCEDRARTRGEPYDVYVKSFRPLKHALTGRDERTMMKLIVDRTSDKVLGAHIVGSDAPEIIQGFAVALRAGATKAHFDSTIGIHPTAAEELVTMRDKRVDPIGD